MITRNNAIKRLTFRDFTYIISTLPKGGVKMKRLVWALTLVAMMSIACSSQKPQQATEQAPDTTQVQPAESTVTDTTVVDTSAQM